MRKMQEKWYCASISIRCCWGPWRIPIFNFEAGDLRVLNAFDLANGLCGRKEDF